jgi:hypothetical protein
MSTQLPTLEARVSAQERRQLILDARIEELSQDITSASRQKVNYQGLEARVSAQEIMQKTLHSRIEELSQDMTASFRQQAEYQIQTECKIDARFDKVEARIAKIEANMATKEDIAAIKEDMKVMEGRMLDAFKQLLTVIDSRLPPPQA